MQEAEEFDLGAALGAEETFSVQKIVIYLPDRDRKNEPVPDIEDYVQAAMITLLDINTGVTRLPPAYGKFKDSDTGIVAHENTHLVYSFVMDSSAFESRVVEITDFIRDFGKKTNQKSVMVEFSGEIPDPDGGIGKYFCRAYSIKKF